MASPTYQAIGSAASTAATSTVNWPIHAAGDIGLLVMESSGATDTTDLNFFNTSTRAMWDPVPGFPLSDVEGTDGSRLWVYWRRATSGSEAGVAIDASGLDHLHAVIITFRGCVSSGQPFSATAVETKSSASTDNTFPAVTTTITDSLIVNIVARPTDSSSAAFSSWANADLSSITERYDAGTTTGNGGGLGIATGGLATPGSSGETTATGPSTTGVLGTIALISEADTPSPAVEYVGFATDIISGADTALSLSVGDSLIGDYLAVCVVGASVGQKTTPSGWTQLISDYTASNELSYGVYVKIAESDAETFSQSGFSTGNDVAAIMMAFRSASSAPQSISPTNWESTTKQQYAIAPLPRTRIPGGMMATFMPVYGGTPSLAALSLNLTKAGAQADSNATVVGAYGAMRAVSFPSTGMEQKLLLNGSTNNQHSATYTIFLEPGQSGDGLFWANNC